MTSGHLAAKWSMSSEWVNCFVVHICASWFRSNAPPQFQLSPRQPVILFCWVFGLLCLTIQLMKACVLCLTNTSLKYFHTQTPTKIDNNYQFIQVCLSYFGFNWCFWCVCVCVCVWVFKLVSHIKGKSNQNVFSFWTDRTQNCRGWNMEQVKKKCFCVISEPFTA